MPPKSSRKFKKPSQIEDNNELRLSLMQRSIPPPQPPPLVPLTDMSPPPPPPPPFEIRDLPLRSSSSGTGFITASATATAPAADTATASTATSTTASTGISVARSIRCKDLDLNVSGTSASKTQQMVRVGGKIIVEYSDEHRGPANEAIHSLISHDIGTTVSGLGRSGRKSPKERGGTRAFASESILAEKLKSQEEQLQAVNERIRQLEGQYADIHEIVR